MVSLPLNVSSLILFSLLSSAITIYSLIKLVFFLFVQIKNTKINIVYHNNASVSYYITYVKEKVRKIIVFDVLFSLKKVYM